MPRLFPRTANLLKPESKIILRIIFVIHELIVLRLLVQHEMWRDEIQAWSIAKASSTPLDVIRNTRFEGRPPLWQLIIWPLAKVFSDPNVMKILTFLMGSIAIWIWLHRSPQPLLLRACISFGFLFTGGYFVHSRDYIAMFLILMLITETFRRRGVANSFVVLICGLSLINLFGLIIAGALVLSILIPHWWQIHSERNKSNQLQCALHFVLTSTTFLFSAYWIYPKSTSQFGVGNYLNWYKPLSNSVFPFLSSNESKNILFAVLAIAVLGVLTIGIFLQNRSAAIFLLSACFVLALNASFGYAFYWWHWGPTAIVLISAPLLFNAPTDGTSNIPKALVNVCLSIIAISGLWANFRGPGEDVYGKQPYSMSQKTAHQIKKLCVPECQVIVDWDATGSSISAYLDGKSLYYLNRQEFGTYAKFVRTNIVPTWQQAIEEMRKFDRPILVTTDLLVGPLPPEFELVEAPWGGVWDNALIVQLGENPIRSD